MKIAMTPYCTCFISLAPFLPGEHSTPLVRYSELDQQDPANRKYDVLVRQITAEDHLECSVKVK